MIIVSQDKTKIVNFDNLIQIYITQDEEETVNFIRYESVDSLYEDLGEYKTEERAKEVLQEIISKYKTTLYNSKTNETVVNIPKVYEMPINWGDKMNKYYESTKKYLKTPKGVLNIIYRNQLLKQTRKRKL